MAWCAGDWRILRSGSGRNSASLSARRRSATNCMRLTTASSPPACATTPRPPERSRVLKNLPSRSGGSRARQGHRSGRCRNLVCRRSARRPEEQDHPAPGPPRHSSGSAEGPAHRLDLHPRLVLPRCDVATMKLQLNIRRFIVDRGLGENFYQVSPEPAVAHTARYMTHILGMRCRENSIEHRLAKLNIREPADRSKGHD